MADIMSRIILQAQGGDQVAREVGKVTEAYKKAGTASRGMSAEGVGGADPFTKATASAPGGYLSSLVQKDRDLRNQQHSEGVRQREGQHNALASVNQRAFRGMGAGTTVAGGDVVGGISQGMGMLAGAGVAGLVAGAVAAIGVGINKLASNETERQQQFGRGLMQAIAPGPWDIFRTQTNALLLGGVPPEMLLPYLQGLKGGGAAYDPVNAMEIGMTMWGQGIEPGTMAGWQAARQRAGTGNLTPGVMNTTMYRGREAFGQGGLNRFISAITDATEQAMTRGIEKGGDAFSATGIYTNFTRLLSSFAVVGGLTDVGAIKAFQQTQQGVAGTQNITSPMDAALFMAMRVPGESYGDTMRRLSAPGAENQMFEQMEVWSGGNRELLEIMLQQKFGYDWQALAPGEDGRGGVIGTFRDQAGYLRGPRGRRVPGAVGIVDPELKAAAIAEAEAGQLMEDTQRKALAAKRAIIGAATDIKEWMSPTGLNAVYGDRPIMDAFMFGRENRATLFGQATTDWQQGVRNWERWQEPGLAPILETLPANMRGIVGQLAGTEAGAKIIPQLLMYSEFQAGRGVEAEREQIGLLAPYFDRMVQILSSESVQQALGQPGTQTQFLAHLEEVGASEVLDVLKDIDSGIEVLEALTRTLGLESYSDIGSTQ